MAFFIGGTGVEATEGLEIVADGQSPYVIALAEGAEERLIQFAGEELRSAILEGTGVDLPVVPESEVPEGAPAIYLGRSKAATAAGLPVEDVSYWKYMMRAVGEDIFLVGDEDPGTGDWGRGQYSGSLKAVTAFLEEFLGVRYVLPGPLGRHVPQVERLVVDVDLDRSWAPLFEYLLGRRVGRGIHIEPYAVANNLPAVIQFHHGKRFFAGGSHTYPEFVPREKYFETNPEYFAMFRGERVPTERNHLCISNPEVHEILLREMEKKFDAGYEMVMLGQSDGYRECQCENCQAIHPDMGEKLWIINTMLAEEMRQRRPEGKVVLLSYVSTTKPPMTFTEFPENVVIMNNRYVPEYFRIWEDYKDVPKMVYLPKWLGRYRPGSPRYSVDLVRLWLENNVKGIYLGGGLDCGSGSGWGLYGPRYYAFGKALANPSLCADELEREYIEASYGEAAGPMREFWSLLHRRSEFLALVDRLNVGMPDRQYRGYPFNTKPSDLLTHLLAPEILQGMTAALDQALELAEDEAVQARLELLEGEFRWLRSTARMHHMLRAYRLAPGPETLALVEAEVKERAETIEWLQPDGRLREPGGRRMLRSPFHHDPPGMPEGGVFAWDFEAIRESGEYPVVNLDKRIRGGQRLPPYEFDPEAPEFLMDGVLQEQETGFHDETITAPFDQ